MQLSDFDYVLPTELIANFPTTERTGSRLMCLDRASGRIKHNKFTQLEDILTSGDLLICNNTKVIPARLEGKKISGGKVEIFIERILDQKRVLAKVRRGKSLKAGSKLFVKGFMFEMVARCNDLFELKCCTDISVSDVIDNAGEIPLPPYINRASDENDALRYQTVFAKNKGSVAAPTAGLHFDIDLLNILRKKGVNIEMLTLHVGAGTYSPVRVDDIRNHSMHAEHIEVSKELCECILRTKKNGGRVIAVGTTSARALESASVSGELQPFSGDTSIFIYPGYKFNCIDGLITNFHLPKSTLLMLVSALAGRAQTLAAYNSAIKSGYRFFSYGDAMLIV